MSEQTGTSATPGSLAPDVAILAALSPYLGLGPHQRAGEEIAHKVDLYISFQLSLSLPALPSNQLEMECVLILDTLILNTFIEENFIFPT